MPELTDHHVEDLFTDLRSAELHLVRPPGAGVARRTVRRRRINTSVAVGVALASVTAVGVAELSSAATVDGKAAAAMAMPAQRVMEAMRVKAEAVIWKNPPMSTVEPLSGSSTLAGDFVQAGDVVPGAYEVTMACVGTGAATVSLITGTRRPEGGAMPSGDLHSYTPTVPCGSDPRTVTTTVTVPAPGYLYVDVRPEARTRGNAAFAYQARLKPEDALRLTRTATVAVQSATAGEVVSGTSAGFLREGGGVPSARFLQNPGTYRLEVACAGRGNVAPILGIRDRMVKVVTCGEHPEVETRTFVIKEGDEPFRPMLLSGEAAEGQAAAAFRVTRQ